MSLPNEIQVGRITASVQRTDSFGMESSPESVRITIDGREPEVLQHLMLFQMLTSLADDMLSGYDSDPDPERSDYLHQLAPALFRIISESGLWTGVPAESAHAFFEEAEKPGQAHQPERSRLGKRTRCFPGKKPRA